MYRATKRFVKKLLTPMAEKIVIGTWSGRTLKTFPDDVYIVSYPKSGNTWTRFLIGNLCFQNERIDFTNLEQRVPNVNMMTHQQLLKLPHPRVFKSHDYFVPTYRKVINIVRDPRDVAVSYYHHNVKRGFLEEGYDWDLYIDRFVRGDLDIYGSWAENVGSWLGAREFDPDYLLLRYEDMLSHTADSLRKVATHLDIDVTDEKLVEIVEYCSFDNMRKLENEQKDSWYFTRDSKQDMNFVRSGKKKNWKDALTAEQLAKIEEPWADIMKKLGYKTAEQMKADGEY